MRRLALILALNLLAAAIYGVVALQMGFFSHMAETLFWSPDSHSYREVADWLFRAIPSSPESLHRPFLYPLLLGAADRLGGAPGIWALNFLFWLGTLNLTAAATWRLTGRALLAVIVFLILALNVSLIALSFQALTELTVAFLESIWILALASTQWPPARPRDIAILLTPLALLTVVKPQYQLEIAIALLLLAAVIWRMPQGRAPSAIALVACLAPIAFQLGLNAVANHFVGLSSTGSLEVKGYYVSQVYASINGLPDDLVAARQVVNDWTTSQVASFLLQHPEPAARTLIANLHYNLTSGSAFVDPAKTPLLAAVVQNTNRVFYRLHFVFLPVVALAIWRRRDLRLFLLYAFAAALILTSSLIYDQGDRYVEMAIPFWAAAYALAVSDLWPDLARSLTRLRLNPAQRPEPPPGSLTS